MDTRSTPRRRLQTQYLVGYNLGCAVLWTAVLGRVILLVPIAGYANVHSGTGEFTKWTQTLALLEVVHSAFGMIPPDSQTCLLFSFLSLSSSVKADRDRTTGLVRSPLLTTIMQVSSRLLLVGAVVNRYPSATAPSPFYSFMLLAWSVTEVIRYSYFVWNLQGNGVPGFVTWLRYNTFYVLYPIGISSECALLWKGSMIAERPVQLVFWGLLGVYIPGPYLWHRRLEEDWLNLMQGVISFSRI